MKISENITVKKDDYPGAFESFGGLWDTISNSATDVIGRYIDGIYPDNAQSVIQPAGGAKDITGNANIGGTIDFKSPWVIGGALVVLGLVVYLVKK